MSTDTNTSGRPRKTLRRRIARRMYDQGWARSAYDNTLRSRLYRIAADHNPWWDWGHPVMHLTGRDWGGNSNPPRGRDLWYIHKSEIEKPHQHLLRGLDRRGSFIVTWDYADVRRTREVSWKILDVQDDGHTIKFGYYDDNGGFYGLSRAEQKLMLWWLIIECRARGEWFGLRRWIYYKALHAAVAQKKPFTCQQVPPPGSGGYDHWHCRLPRRHAGDHRFNNYTWSEHGSEHVKFTDSTS